MLYELASQSAVCPVKRQQNKNAAFNLFTTVTDNETGFEKHQPLPKYFPAEYQKAVHGWGRR